MKSHKKSILIIVILLCLITLSSCWDAKELDDLSIPSVVACDTTLTKEKKYPADKYIVSMLIPMFYKNTEKRLRVVASAGKIPGETRGRRDSRLGDKAIFGQMQILLFGEELARKENLLEVTDIFTRNPSVKLSVFLAVVNGRGVDLLKKQIPYYPNVGIYLRALLKKTRDSNFYPNTNLFRFNRGLISYETAVLLPYISSEKEELVLAGSCLINNGKMAAKLGMKETETAVLLKGIKCRGTLPFEVSRNGKTIDEVSFEGTNTRKVTVKRIKDKYAFDIRIKLMGIIAEHKSQEPIQDSIDLLKLFQESLEKDIKKKAEAFVEKTQKEYKFDALDLANHIKAHTREKLSGDDIDRIVQESDINVEVKVQILNSGGKM